MNIINHSGDKKGESVGVGPDYGNEYDTFGNDVVGDSESDDDDRDRKKRRDRDEEEEGEELPSFMFFDFRRGIDAWPSNVELVDPKRAEQLLEKATTAAEEAAKAKKKDDDDDGHKKGSSSGTTFSWDKFGAADEEEEEVDFVPSDAQFEMLKDGSTALVIKPGHRLKLRLNDILDGGDAEKEERDRKAAKMKKRAAQYSGGSSWMGGGISGGVGMGGGGGGKSDMDYWDMDMMGGGGKKKWFKEYVNEYTITIDMKLLDAPPRDGVALFQTALIHSSENKRSGKTTLSRSDGECLINQAGGIGMFGTYGDTTKAKLEPGIWKRVTVAVKCTDDQNGKGEFRTWVGTEAGVMLKEESITANDRFAIDPDNFFLFSSAQTAMMPGNIAIRTVRVEMTFASDKDVKANRARDKVIGYLDLLT